MFTANRIYTLPAMKKALFICLLLVNAAGFAQVNLKEGLVAYYPFSGNAVDESGNNNDPVFNNATLTADRFGNPNSAYHFNGINSYMKIPNRPGINMSNQVTLSAWVRPTGFYYGVCHASCILSKGLGNYMPGDYALRFDDALYSKGNGCADTICDTVHQNFRGTGTTMEPYTPFINKDKWYSVTYTNDGTTAKLYVDCKLAYSIKFPETFTNNLDLYFGRVNDEFFPFWFNGDLDEVRIYSKALDSAAIFALCNTKPPMVKPVEAVKPVVLEERKKELVRQITVDHDSVTVTLYDNGVVDGDSVTLIYNKAIITQHLRLTEKPVTFTIKIDAAGKNELQMYAENMGSIPPNTALMVIYDGNKRYEVTIRSTEKTNGAVSFKLKE